MLSAQKEIYRKTETPRTVGIGAFLNFVGSSSGSPLEEHSWRHVGRFGEQLCRSYRIPSALCPAVISRVYEPSRSIVFVTEVVSAPTWLSWDESTAESASWDIQRTEIVDDLDAILDMLENQALRVSSDLLAVASDALESLDSRSDESVDDWARRLSQDVSDAVD